MKRVTESAPLPIAPNQFAGEQSPKKKTSRSCLIYNSGKKRKKRITKKKEYDYDITITDISLVIIDNAYPRGAMYLTYYNLKHKPFQISTDPGFLWLGEKHMEALSTLRYGVLDNKGFLLLTGDVGTGKTTLINALLKTLGEDVLVACIRDPGLEPIVFFNYVANAFGMEGEILSKGGFLIRFEQFLSDIYDQHKKALLIIDEAQRITQELLEEVRLLSNIEKTDSKLLNIFFVGQIEFNDILLRPVNRPIRQRITINYNIETLSRLETEKYIRHRLAIARRGEPPPLPEENDASDSGMFVQERLPSMHQKDEQAIFSDKAIREVYRFSNGYPRLINIICDRALLTGYVEEAEIITAQHVRECAKELEIPSFEKERHEDSFSQEQPPSSVTLDQPPLNVPIAEHQLTEPEQKPERKESQTENREKSTRHSSPFHKYSVALSIAVVLLAALLLFFSLNPALTSRILERAQETSVGQYLLSTYRSPGSARSSDITEVSTPNDLKNETASAMAKEKPSEHVIKPSPAASATETNSTPENPLLQKTPKRAVPPHGTTVPLSLSKLILPFAEDAALPPLQSLANLDMVIDSVINQPATKIIVTGFADTSNDEPENRKTSLIKAEAIRIYLISRGLDSSRLETHGLGSQDPLTPGSTPAGRAANQRVEIELRQ